MCVKLFCGIGKWHQGWDKGVGDQFYHPYNHGFDYFFGLPFTMTHDFGFAKSVIKYVMPNYWVPIVKAYGIGVISSLIIGGLVSRKAGFLLFVWVSLVAGYFMLVCNTYGWWNTGLARGRDVIEMPTKLEGLTQRLIEEGQGFIRREVSMKKPVFLLMSWLHVHATLHPMQRFKGEMIKIL